VARKPAVGDVVEIDTDNGLAYAQFTHRVPNRGDLIRVLPGIYKSRPEDIQALVRQKEIWVTFVALDAIVAAGIFPVVANVEVPEAAQPFPMMRAGAPLPSGRVARWRLFDGEVERPVEELTEELAELSIVEIPNPALLRERIASGWHPRMYVGKAARTPTESSGITAAANPSAPVVIQFDDVAEADRTLIYLFEDSLEARLRRQDLGEVDGNRAGAGSHSIYIYSANPKGVETVARSLLSEWGLSRKAKVLVPHEAPEQ
jgi:hypothetical protein